MWHQIGVGSKFKFLEDITPFSQLIAFLGTNVTLCGVGIKRRGEDSNPCVV